MLQLRSRTDRLHHVVARLAALPRAFALGRPRLLTLALLVFVASVVASHLHSLRVPIVGEHDYRQADTYAIAYNFAHDHAPFFFPRNDWTGGLSGITGMEVPIYAWCSAKLMRIFGYAPSVLRTFTFAVFGAATLLFAYALGKTKGRATAVAFLAFLAVSPLVRCEFRQIQPDPTMASLAIAAAAMGHLYARSDKRWQLALSVTLYTLSVLTKPIAIAIAPAMVLFTLFGARRRLGVGALVQRLALFSIPWILWSAWDHWSKYLVAKYADGHLVFSFAYDLGEMRQFFLSPWHERHIWLRLVPTYVTSWAMLPAVLAGAVLAARRRDRSLGVPFFAWLAGVGFICGCFSDRLISNWYYSILFVPPVAYFGALGLGNVLDLASGSAKPGLVERFGAAFVLLGFAATPNVVTMMPNDFLPGRDLNMPNQICWLGDAGAARLAALAIASLVLAIVVEARLAEKIPRLAWFAAAASAGSVGFEFAHRETTAMFRTYSHQLEWRDAGVDVEGLREVIDRRSVRADTFLADIRNPWFLHLPLRRGFCEDAPTIDRVGLAHFVTHGTRFVIHYPGRAGLPLELRTRKVLDEGRGWALYCVDPKGCGPR